MTTPGDHRASTIGPVRRRTARTFALVGLLAVAATGATWAEVHYAGRTPNGPPAAADGSSQDGAGLTGGSTVSGTGGAGQVRLDAVLPATVTAPASVTSPNGYQGTRYAAAFDSSHCAPAFNGPAQPSQSAQPSPSTGAASGTSAGTGTAGMSAAATGSPQPTGTAQAALNALAALATGCTGFLAADYVRQGDHAVYSSVTVLDYGSARSAGQAADKLKAGPALALLQFRQPDKGLPPLTVGRLPNGSSVQLDVKVSLVGSSVTIVQTAFADGSAATSELDTPNWFLSYTAGNMLTWNS